MASTGAPRFNDAYRHPARPPSRSSAFSLARKVFPPNAPADQFGFVLVQTDHECRMYLTGVEASDGFKNRLGVEEIEIPCGVLAVRPAPTSRDLLLTVWKAERTHPS
ncbi:hypothetical protein NBRC10513_007588 [Rhodotorula toruloides]